MSNGKSACIPAAALAALLAALAATGCATSATYHKLEGSSRPREQAPIDLGRDTVSALGSIDRQKLAQPAGRQPAPDLGKAIVLYGEKHTYVLLSGADQMLSVLQQFPPDFFEVRPDVFHLGKPADAYQSVRGNIALVAAAADEAAPPPTDTQMALLRRASFAGGDRSGYSRTFNVQGVVLPARAVPDAERTAQKWSRRLTLDLVQDRDPLPPIPAHAAVAKMAGALLLDVVTSPLQILYYTLRY